MVLSNISRWLLLGTLVVAVSIATQPGLNAQEPGPLDGRLGGTVESWIAAYGDPIVREGRPALFIEIEMPGLSSLLLSEKDGIVYRAWLYAPRPAGEEWSMDGQPHEMNWSVVEGQTLALEFLPRDVVLLGRLKELPEFDMMVQACESPALLAGVDPTVYDFTDATPVYGGCSYQLQLDTDGQVTAISVELEIEDELFE